jgi:hypothetical protein
MRAVSASIKLATAEGESIIVIGKAGGRAGFSNHNAHGTNAAGR